MENEIQSEEMKELMQSMNKMLGYFQSINNMFKQQAEHIDDLHQRVIALEDKTNV